MLEITIKEYLSQNLWLDQKLGAKLEQLEKLRSMATKVTANLREEKVSGGSSNKSRLENTVVKIVALEREIKEDVDRLIAVKTDVLNTIKQVTDPVSQIVLEMRYINGRSWEEIARGMGFDIRTAFRIHGKALKQIEWIKKCQ